MQDFLAGLVYTRRRSCDRCGQFIPAGREVGPLRRFPDLSDDVAKLCIGGGEGQAAFDLDLQCGWGAVPIDCFDYHIVEWVFCNPLLKGDAADGFPREAARFGACE